MLFQGAECAIFDLTVCFSAGDTAVRLSHKIILAKANFIEITMQDAHIQTI